MNHHAVPTGLPEYRFPIEPWRLVEREFRNDDLGLTETIFALGNGYLGMRANPEEGRDAHSHGTFLNGFHETWEIQHAEDAFGFAKTGQTIVNVPDAKVMKLYVDDEPLLLTGADLDEYERSIDFRTGILERDLVWRTPAGKRVRVRSTRMVSMVHRHLAVMTFEITLLDAAAPVVVSSQMMNRQDGEDEYHVKAAALGEGMDPRKARKFFDRVLRPRLQREHENEIILGYRCNHSGMTLACGTRHMIETACDVEVTTQVSPDLAKTVFSVRATVGEPIRITKLVTYHSSTGVPAEELADRCTRSLGRAETDGADALLAEQREWFDAFWKASDIELCGDDKVQQAIRWNIFQLAQASARTHEQGIAAKGVTGGGYDGHYFWDTEVYVVPFLAYTDQEAARKVVRFRWAQLGAACQRATEMSQVGALFPWRTINGEEASAYYAAGTAQYHINAAVVFALRRYLEASGDVDFLAHEGAEMLVETARLWADLGFYGSNGSNAFHIHRVTGPDEYTTVVNDNTYTNVMARFNLRYAARTVRFLAEWNPQAFEAVRRNTDLDLGELDDWDAAADAMFIPFDEELGIHPQDASFLELEPWDWEGTPASNYPAAAPLPPARHLPPSGAQAGRRRAGLVPAARELLRRAEAAQLRLLRPDHHGRLVAVGVRAVDRRGRGRLRRTGARLLPPGALPRPVRLPRQHRRRGARRQCGRRLGRHRPRVRGHGRTRRPRRIRAPPPGIVGPRHVPSPAPRCDAAGRPRDGQVHAHRPRRHRRADP